MERRKKGETRQWMEMHEQSIAYPTAAAVTIAVAVSSLVLLSVTISPLSSSSSSSLLSSSPETSLVVGESGFGHS